MRLLEFLKLSATGSVIPHTNTVKQIAIANVGTLARECPFEDSDLHILCQQAATCKYRTSIMEIYCLLSVSIPYPYFITDQKICAVALFSSDSHYQHGRELLEIHSMHLLY